MTSHELKCALADYGRAALITASLLAYTAGGMAVSVKRAAGHVADTGMVYDAICCRSAATSPSGDCAPIPTSSVTPAQNGWRVTVKPGDHPLVTAAHSFLVPYSMARESSDGRFHLCLYPNESTVQCFYRPPFGS